MTIDPLEAIITWLETELTSVDGRVAGKHRYGESDGWAEDENGVSVHLDGGLPELYASIATPRLEIRIYDSNQPGVVSVWRELIELSRSDKRFEVDTSQGMALVHNFLPETNLSLLYDDALKKDMGIVFFNSMVAEEEVI